ncbi:MAG: DMT family transporter [Fidelibacterota bacterium]
MRPKVLILYLLLMVIWSTSWMAIKVSLRGTPPILGVGLRFGLSAAILWIVLLARREKLVISGPAVQVYAGFGLLNFALSYSLTYWGTQFIYSGLTAVLWATLPIFVAFLAHFMLPNDPMTWRKSVGVGSGLLGTFLIFSPGNALPPDFRMIGVGAVLLAVIVAAWPNVLYKKHRRILPPLHLNVVAQSLAAAILLPLSFLLEEPGEMVWDLVNLGVLAYLTIFATIITWSIYLWLFSYLSVTQISAIALVPPVIASLLGWVFLGEVFTPTMMLGSVFVLAGIFMIHAQRIGAKRAASR